jgi:hypothetical protein
MSSYIEISDAEMEQNLQERENGTVVLVKPGQKTAGLCLVWVAIPPRQSWLGF